MIEIGNILSELSKERPVFHCEADFQHALAWKIHEEYPSLSMRLEKKLVLDTEQIYVDIFAFEDNRVLAIELGYKTRELNIEVIGEEFNLTFDRAQDQGRYDFIEDISRLERALVTYHGWRRICHSTHKRSPLLGKTQNYRCSGQGFQNP